MADLKRKAWKTFSKWIRERDQRCVTCGRSDNLHAGHFWHNVLDFDEENINAQCIGCNTFKNGNLAVYSTYLLRKLGQKKFEELDIRHTMALKGEKRTDEDHQKIIDKYK